MESCQIMGKNSKFDSVYHDCQDNRHLKTQLVSKIHHTSQGIIVSITFDSPIVDGDIGRSWSLSEASNVPSRLLFPLYNTLL